MRHRTLVRSAVVAALLAGGVAATAIATLAERPHREKAKVASVGAPTSVVARRDLSETQDLDATLGFGDERTVIARAPGILTTILAAGATAQPGQHLYAVDGNPVVLLDGRRPAWRNLAEGMSNGADVRELEQNLERLGCDPGHLLKVDAHFSAATRAAVETLQRRLGMTPTGSLPLGSVVFLPGNRRVTSVFARPGDAVAAEAQLLTTASTARVATVTLDTSQRSLVAVGQRVGVVLPDSRSVSGTVASVGATATSNPQDASGGGTPDSTINVEVTIQAHVTEPDGTPVTVRVTTETHRHVLSVPVTALLAIAGGRRSLEVVRPDASTEVVPVRTGLYAGGYVEVAGRGIKAGTRILVAPGS